MNIVLKRQPQIALAALANFIESKNTKGSGKRFVKKFSAFIEKYAKENVSYSLCSNTILASFKYSCVFFNKWTIAFTIEKNSMVIQKIIHGTVLQ